MSSKMTTYEDVRRHVTSLQRDLELLREWSLRREPEAKRLAKQWLALTEAIPGCYPDGTGILSPSQWVRWAKTQLGYDVLENAGMPAGQSSACSEDGGA